LVCASILSVKIDATVASTLVLTVTVVIILRNQTNFSSENDFNN
jgi:hypothetical protein